MPGAAGQSARPAHGTDPLCQHRGTSLEASTSQQFFVAMPSAAAVPAVAVGEEGPCQCVAQLPMACRAVCVAPPPDPYHGALCVRPATSGAPLDRPLTAAGETSSLVDHWHASSCPPVVGLWMVMAGAARKCDASLFVRSQHVLRRMHMSQYRQPLLTGVAAPRTTRDSPIIRRLCAWTRVCG